MGWFARMFGSDASRSVATLDDLAKELGLSARAKPHPEQGGILKAKWNGALLVVRHTGDRASECRLRFAPLDGTFRLDYDRRDRKKPVVPLPAATPTEDDDDDDDDDGKRDPDLHLGGGVTVHGHDWRGFAALPEPLRARLHKGMIANRIRLLVACSEELTLDFDTGPQAFLEHIAGALRLAMELSQARGLAPASREENRGKTWTVPQIASRFARLVPGATVEDFMDDPRSPLHAAVFFEHAGTPARLAFYRTGEDTCNVWLEVRAEGVHGSFKVISVTDPPADGDGPRIFVSPRGYVEGERTGHQLARVLSLPGEERQRLLSLCETNLALSLDEQLLSLLVCEVFAFLARLEQPGFEQPLLAAVAELAAIARAFPPQAKVDAEGARAIECAFCGAMFALSPQTPACARCGGAAQSAT